MQDNFTRMDRDCNLLLVNSRNCERSNMQKNRIKRTLQKKNINSVAPRRDENENGNNHSSAMLFHHYQTMNNLKRETNVDRGDTHSFQPVSPPRRDMTELSHVFQLYNVANARKPYSSSTSNSTRGKKMTVIRDKCNNNGARNRIHSSSLYATRKIHHLGREHHDSQTIIKQNGLYEYGNGNRGQYPTVTSAICFEIVEDDISEITTPETIRSS